MPDTGADMFMTNWGRFVAVVYVIFFLYTCRRRVFPVKGEAPKNHFSIIPTGAFYLF